MSDLNSKPVEEEENVIRQKAQEIARGVYLPMALKSAIELDILEIISEASERGAHVSAYEVAHKIRGCVNPDAPTLLESILSLLASFSVLKCELRRKDLGGFDKVYGVAPVCKYFLKNKASGTQDTLASFIMLHYDTPGLQAWNHLTDAILEGGVPFNKAHGMSLFEYTAKNSRQNKLFHDAMVRRTTTIIENILDVYRGFEGIDTLVDVGGGVGITLNLITSKYPNMKGINFDLPHVLATAAIKSPGVEHIGGDMFKEVPCGDAIILKWILHNWNDEHSIKLLKNCWKALPENGKVIVVEKLLPLAPENNYETQTILSRNLGMYTLFGGLERNIEAFKYLALQAGFSSCHVICSLQIESVIELNKA